MAAVCVSPTGTTFRSSAGHGELLGDAPLRPRVVMCSVPCDAHTWNLVHLELVMTEAGTKVYNLGPCTPVDIVVDACAEYTPDLLVVSTVNGHGLRDALHLRVSLDALGASAPRAIVGGKLGIPSGGRAAAEEMLLRAGFNEVFLDEPADTVRFHNLLQALTPAAS